MAELTLGTDWGSYLFWDQRVQFNWQELYDKAGLRFAIFRGDQEQIDPYYGNYSTVKNLEDARRVLPIAGCYYWHYPNGSQVYYLDRYKKAIYREQPDFIAVDLEQTTVWNGSAYVTVNPQLFSDTAQQLCEGLRDVFPEKQIIIYTRRDIITKYSPQLANWIGAFDGGWEAAGVDYGLESYNLTWDQIAGFMCKVYPTGELKRINNTGATSIPTWTHNKLWQYSGRIRYPYTWLTIYGHQYDTNCWFGTEAELIAWVNKTTPPPQEGPDIYSRMEQIETWAKTLGYPGPK